MARLRFMQTELKWNIEAFRQFLNFEVMQQACASIMPIDGFNYRDDINDSKRFELWLTDRTDLEWTPRRSVPEGIHFNPEGSVFRNKARVFTSMGVVDAAKLQNERVVLLTDFGRNLGGGLISKSEYYQFQVANYSYPHPAYPESAITWAQNNVTVKPFELILRVLIILTQEYGLSHNSLSSQEFARFFMQAVPDFNAAKIAEKIIASRDSVDDASGSEYAKENMRNATDIFGFLALSGLVYFVSAGVICLNLISVSSKDKTYFHFKNREGESAIDNIRKSLRIEEE